MNELEQLIKIFLVSGHAPDMCHSLIIQTVEVRATSHYQVMLLCDIHKLLLLSWSSRVMICFNSVKLACLDKLK